jgi:hypothetical protein
MRRLTQTFNMAIRGPKKKTAVETEMNTDYINIFKDK